MREKAQTLFLSSIIYILVSLNFIFLISIIVYSFQDKIKGYELFLRNLWQERGVDFIIGYVTSLFATLTIFIIKNTFRNKSSNEKKST